MAECGDHNEKTGLKDDLFEQHKPIKKGELIIIDLPPPPEDFMRVCDPLMENELRTAIVSTICCWLPLGILPAIFGLIGIHFAIKAEKCDDPVKKRVYSSRSSTISWIGMLLFITVLTLATVILATCGIL